MLLSHILSDHLCFGIFLFCSHLWYCVVSFTTSKVPSNPASFWVCFLHKYSNQAKIALKNVIIIIIIIKSGAAEEQLGGRLRHWDILTMPSLFTMPAFVVPRKYLITTPVLVFDREPYCELETDLKIVSHDTRPLDFRKVWTPESWVMFWPYFV